MCHDFERLVCFSDLGYERYGGRIFGRWQRVRNTFHERENQMDLRRIWVSREMFHPGGNGESGSSTVIRNRRRPPSLLPLLSKLHSSSSYFLFHPFQNAYFYTINLKHET